MRETNGNLAGVQFRKPCFVIFYGWSGGFQVAYGGCLAGRAFEYVQCLETRVEKIWSLGVGHVNIMVQHCSMVQRRECNTWRARKSAPLVSLLQRFDEQLTLGQYPSTIKYHREALLSSAKASSQVARFAFPMFCRSFLRKMWAILWQLWRSSAPWPSNMWIPRNATTFHCKTKKRKETHGLRRVVSSAKKRITNKPANKINKRAVEVSNWLPPYPRWIFKQQPIYGSQSPNNRGCNLLYQASKIQLTVAYSNCMQLLT